jgi:hypothetical protein
MQSENLSKQKSESENLSKQKSESEISYKKMLQNLMRAYTDKMKEVAELKDSNLKLALLLLKMEHDQILEKEHDETCQICRPIPVGKKRKMKTL